jgi:hypothetical protein
MSSKSYTYIKMPLKIVFNTESELNQFMLRKDKMGTVEQREDGTWLFTNHKVRKEGTTFPSPDCEFCKAHKTWDTTRYIKTKNGFLNKDACITCWESAPGGFEAGYFDDDVCETCNKALKPGEGKSQLSGSFSCILCPGCYEGEKEED